MAGFRLAGLLRLRDMQEEQAAAELARSHAERRAAQRRREETEDVLAGTDLPMRGDHLTWQAAIAGRAAATGLVGEATVALDVAAVQVRTSTDLWSDARTRATTLAKLEARHQVTVRAEEERLEQLVLDEAAARTRRSQVTDHTTGRSADQTPATTPQEER